MVCLPQEVLHLHLICPVWKFNTLFLHLLVWQVEVISCIHIKLVNKHILKKSSKSDPWYCENTPYNVLLIDLWSIKKLRPNRQGHLISHYKCTAGCKNVVYSLIIILQLEVLNQRLSVFISFSEFVCLNRYRHTCGTSWRSQSFQTASQNSAFPTLSPCDNIVAFKVSLSNCQLCRIPKLSFYK